MDDDVESVRDLFHASYRRLVGQLTAVTGSHAEAEDAVQEAFVRAVDRARSVRRTDTAEAWLRTVAVNVARSRFRRNRGSWGPDGRSRPVADAAGGDVTAGDVLARTRAKGLAVVDPRSATTWDLPGPSGAKSWEVGAVGSDGTTWLMPMAGGGTPPGVVALHWLRDARWHQHVLWDQRRSTGGTAMPGVLAVSGHHVAAVSSFDGATLTPVGKVAVSADNGETWTDLTRDQVPFETVDSMAATSGGTLYVVGVTRGLGQWRVFRSTDATWTHFESVPAPPATSGLQPAGPVVLAVSGSGKDVRLLAFDDHGMRPEVPIR
jgi:hypothetical protein